MANACKINLPVKLKRRFPTAQQIADGVEFMSPIKELEGWFLRVAYDFAENPEDENEWIDDFVWSVKKPLNGAKRRWIKIGTQQTGLTRLERLPDEAQGPFQRYVYACWDYKIVPVVREMMRRWDEEERNAEAEGEDEGACST